MDENKVSSAPQHLPCAQCPKSVNCFLSSLHLKEYGSKNKNYKATETIENKLLKSVGIFHSFLMPIVLKGWNKRTTFKSAQPLHFQY